MSERSHDPRVALANRLADAAKLVGSPPAGGARRAIRGLLDRVTGGVFRRQRSLDDALVAAGGELARLMDNLREAVVALEGRVDDLAASLRSLDAAAASDDLIVDDLSAGIAEIARDLDHLRTRFELAQSGQ